MEMKKTSVYLSEEDRKRLARLAERKGESQAWVLREALAAYDASAPDKNFEMFDAFEDLDLPPLPEFENAQDFQDYVDETIRKAIHDDIMGQLYP
jgi:predicted DNA-binding protein